MDVHCTQTYLHFDPETLKQITSALKALDEQLSPVTVTVWRDTPDYPAAKHEKMLFVTKQKNNVFG